MSQRIFCGLATALILTVCLALLGNAGPEVCCDDDSDGVNDDYTDNCTGLANPSQRDDDEDGYGNLCDADVNQDCIIGGPDIGATFSRVLDGAPWTPKNAGAYDVNEDGVVGGPDIGIIFAEALNTPGPSALNCADCTALPTAGIGMGVCPPNSLP